MIAVAYVVEHYDIIELFILDLRLCALDRVQ